MGFQKTSEGRVFFKSPGNDDTPLKKAMAASEPLVPKDNVQMQILLLLKSLNAKLKVSREDQEALSKDLESFKATVRKLEKTGPLTGNAIDSKELEEARKKIQALEKKAAAQETNYIDLEQQVARKQSEVSKKASRVEDNVKKALQLVEEIKVSEKDKSKTYEQLKQDIQRQRKTEEELRKKQAVLEDTQKEQGVKMVDAVATYVALTKRVSETEERHDTLENKIAESLSDYNKLDRKIDKVIEDRNRILRKVERIEQAVLETRDALNAKAMVLLTDQGAMAAPQIADSAMQAAHPLALQKQLEEEALMPWWRKPMRVQLPILVMMAVIILLLGYIISAAQYGQVVQPPENSPATVREEISFASPPPSHRQESGKITDIKDPVEVSSAPVEHTPLVEPQVQPADIIPEAITTTKRAETDVQNYEPDFGITIHRGVDDPAKIKKSPQNIDLSDSQALEEAFEEDPQALAEQLNDIEPSSLQPPDEIMPGTTEKTEPDIKPYQTQAYISGLKQRISPDPKLSDIAKKIETQAFEGIPEAQHDMGAIYVAGHGKVKQDLRRAIAWFTEASDNGVANATYNLGVLHHRGLGVNEDVTQALELYEKAAMQGHAEAQYNLGIANIEGVGKPYNPAAAAEYFERAARQGVMEAAYNLGLIYENGLLGQAEPGFALSWYKYAADQGSPEAQSALNQLAASLNITLDDVKSIVENVRQSNSSAIKNQGDLIADIQKALMDRGFYPGPVDGKMGPVTRSSIRAFQLAADLPINGEPSQTLLKTLQNAAYQ